MRSNNSPERTRERQGAKPEPRRARRSAQPSGPMPRTPFLCFIACLPLFHGCIPRAAVVHDGLKTTIVDSASGEPLSGAFVYDRLDGQTPHVLALGNEKGELLLGSKERITLSGFMGEGLYSGTFGCARRGTFLTWQARGEVGTLTTVRA